MSHGGEQYTMVNCPIVGIIFLFHLYTVVIETVCTHKSNSSVYQLDLPSSLLPSPRSSTRLACPERGVWPPGVRHLLWDYRWHDGLHFS